MPARSPAFPCSRGFLSSAAPYGTTSATASRPTSSCCLGRSCSMRHPTLLSRAACGSAPRPATRSLSRVAAENWPDEIVWCSPDDMRAVAALHRGPRWDQTVGADGNCPFFAVPTASNVPRGKLGFCTRTEHERAISAVACRLRRRLLSALQIGPPSWLQGRLEQAVQDRGFGEAARARFGKGRRRPGYRHRHTLCPPKNGRTSTGRQRAGNWVRHRQGWSGSCTPMQVLEIG